MLYLHSVVCPFGQSVYWSYSSEVALFISGKGRQVSIGWLISHTRKCEPRLLSHISHKNKFQMDLSPKYERQGFLVFRRKPVLRPLLSSASFSQDSLGSGASGMSQLQVLIDVGKGIHVPSLIQYLMFSCQLLTDIPGSRNCSNFGAE